MKGRGEKAINYPISYSKIPCVIIGNTQSYDSTAVTGCYNVSITGFQIKTINHQSVHYTEAWALIVIGI